MLRRVTDAVPPAAGAIVMGTGIVSIGLALDQYETLSRILLGFAVAVWIVLAGALGSRTVRNRERARREARTPAALTAVAASAVLGTRLTVPGWTWAAIGLLVISTLMWTALIAPVLRGISGKTAGVALMVSVATESLAVLSATLAVREGADWLLYVALAPLLLGIALYAFVISRFDLRQLLVGRGDHWITGGALAIAALAVGRILLTADDLGALTDIHGVLKVASLACWALAIAWLPILVIAETARRRPRYDLSRWATVFPVGMYAACSFSVGHAADVSGITDFARVWVWVGFAVWAIVLVSMAGHAASK